MDLKESLGRLIPRKNKTNAISKVLPSRLLLYKQASLSIRDKRELKAPVLVERAGDLNTLFTVAGEVDGRILCVIDMSKTTISGKNLSVLRSLFIESMNILLGHFLTNLEEEQTLLSVLSAPTFFLKEEASEVQELRKFQKFFSSSLNFEASYFLRFIDKEIPIKIYFQLKS